jgi:DNA polymerase III sliding clamp (beta) subunit (PCNA family)
MSHTTISADVIKALSTFCEKPDARLGYVRPKLGAIHVGDGYAESADGYRLMRVNNVQTNGEGDMLIDHRGLLTAAKSAKREGVDIVRGDDGKLRAGANGVVVTVDEIDDTFYDTKQIIPNDDPEYEITVNAKLFAESLLALSKAVDCDTVRLSFHGNTRAIVLTAPDKERATALVMPVVIGAH